MTSPADELLAAVLSDSSLGDRALGDSPGTAATGDGVDAALDGALSALLDFGIRRTSVNEIAKRSGVSPATLYRWFGSKDEIVSAVVLRETRRFLAELEVSIDRDASPEDQMIEVSLAVSQRLGRLPLLRRLIETEPEVMLPRLTTDGAPIIDAGAAYLVRHLERLMDEGRIERFDPVPLATMLARVTHSRLLTPTTALQPDDEAAMWAEAREMYRWLLRLPGRTPE
ncbi:MAG: TetR/AcrR family transcriptional regulator [Actinomycetota bacterium]|nr:TetR/AcrR family transcriptional regulator [Actinomycetota bacterium]